MKKAILVMVGLLSSVLLHAQTLQDTVAVRAFFDGVIQTHLRDKHIAGATVAIIKDGKILLNKGYGFRDEKKQKAVKADSTLFRIGSISKMFTWVSVMQLVAQGKLNLDEDVNHYFKDFKIPETYPQPITLKNLMTHTPGFEDLVIGLFGKDSTSLKPLSEILKSEMPARVRPAGTFASYSNHGTGMAAYIVEQVSGMPFNDYVEKNILQPLGMQMTTFRQPLPESLKPFMSKGYTYEGGEFIEKPFEYVPLFPVGAAASTSTDMIRFMETILNQGRWGSFQMLDSGTLSLMESPAHQHHPDVNPMRYGFMDMSQNGVTVIGHGGDTFWFHSLMALIPSQHAGLFVSFNTDKGGGTYLAVLDEFMNHFYPEKTLRMPMRLGKTYLERFAGDYRANRYAYHDLTSISSLFGDSHITLRDSSALKLTMGENVRYLLPVDSLTFREEHSSKIYAFKKNDKGEITNLFIGQMPIFAFDKITGSKSLGFQSMIFFFVVISMLFTLLYWPFTYLVRRGYYTNQTAAALPLGSKWVAWINYLLLFSFYLGLILSISNPTDIVFGISGSLKTVLVLPMICIALTLFMLVWLFRIWTGRHKFSGKVFYLIISAAAVAALWQLYVWNFIGFNY